MRRLMVVLFGFLVAVSAGMLFLPFAALFDPDVRDAGFATVFSSFFAMIDEALNDRAPQMAASAFFYVLRAVLIATCVAPLAVAALIGEVAGVRAWAWYAGASGFLAAAAPWIARAAQGSPRVGQMTELEGRIALLFFLTGVFSGSIYWLITRRGPEPGEAE